MDFTLGRAGRQGDHTVTCWLKSGHEEVLTLGVLLDHLRRPNGRWTRKSREFADSIADSRGVFRRGILVAINGRQVHSLHAPVSGHDRIEVFVVPAVGGG